MIKKGTVAREFATGHIPSQPDYVNIANIPSTAGIIAVVYAAGGRLCLWCFHRRRRHHHRHPSFIMTLAMMQIANGVSALLVRGQISAYSFPIS